MSLQTQIAKIREKLNKREYANEQAVSQGIVVHLLQTMSWQTQETDKVCPQYTVRGGRVDFALCVNPNEPVIFIEVKQPGGIDDADTQLFEYAFKQSFHGSVDVAVATDGREWRFYWPSGSGSYEKRRFCVVDFLEDDAKKAAAKLQRYLSWENVRSKQALRNAKNDYEEFCNKRETWEHIPKACAKLMAEHRDAVVRAVSEKVKTLCGHTPADEQITEFLETLSFESRSESGDTSPHKKRSLSGKKTPPQSRSGNREKIRVIFPNGHEIYNNAVTTTFVDTLRTIGFAKAARAEIMIAGHPLISKEQHKPQWKDVGDGFFVCTHSSTKGKIEQLQKISERLHVNLKIQTC